MKMATARSPIIYGALFVATLAHAGVSKPCNLQDELAQLLRESKADGLNHLRQVKEPTLFQVGVMEGRSGGKRIVYQLKGTRWGSNYEHERFAVQGDPRWIIDHLGTDGARFFGVEIFPGNKITLPDHAELKGAIKKLNRSLVDRGEEPIAISFYESTPTTEMPGSYLDKYINELAIPISSTEYGRLHDLSAHLTSILLPRNLLEYSAERYRYSRAFIDFLKKKHAQNPSQLKAVEVYEKLMDASSSLQVDNTTSGLSYSIASHAHGEKDIERQIAETFYRHVAPDKYVAENILHRRAEIPTPVQSLTSQIDEMVGDFNIGNSDVTALEVSVAQRNLPSNDLWRDAYEFDSTYKSRTPTFRSGHLYRGSPHSFSQAVSIRRQQIRSAIDQMNKKGIGTPDGK